MFRLSLRVMWSMFRTALAVVIGGTCVACLLKVFVPTMVIQADASTYNAFTLIMGALLLLRLCAAHSRFMQHTSLARSMMDDWLSAASIVVSCPSSEFSGEITQTLIRLMSLLNAVILVDLEAGVSDRVSHCDLLDAQGVQCGTLAKLANMQHRPDVVRQWVQGFIMECVHVASLNVPPSVVPRIIQHLDDGMCKYHELLILRQPTPLSTIASVLLGVHCVLTVFVGDTVASVTFTSVTVFALWSLHSAASEFESIGANRNLHAMHSQLNDRLVSLVCETTSVIPRLRLSVDEAMHRLQDPSLRECEFHWKLFHMFKLQTQTSVATVQRIASPVAFRAQRSVSSSVPSSAQELRSRLGEMLNAMMHIRSQTDSDRFSGSSQDFQDDRVAQHGTDLEAGTPSDSATTSGTEHERAELSEPTRSYEIISENKVGVLSELDPKSKATRYLAPGATFQAKREHWVGGEKFFELSGGGFVSECSRKHRDKIVVAEVNHVRSTDTFVANALASTRTCENYAM